MPGPSDVAKDDHVQPMKWFGVADDGSVAEVEFPVQLMDTVAAKWPPIGLARVPAAPRLANLRIVVVARGDSVDAWVNGSPAWGGWERVESDLALFASERLTGLVAVHAALIEAGGTALMLPGASGVGKSSLAAEGFRFGARVLTDEYVLVDPATGLVTGWRRPVRVRRHPGGVQLLDITQASGPLPVGLIAFATHQPGLATSTWTPLSAAEATLGLMANTVCAQSRPDEALDAALVLARSVPAIEGVRCEAGVAVVDLLDQMAAAAAHRA